MTSKNVTPSKLLVRLSIYFFVLLGVMLLVMISQPESIDYLPFGGSDALDKSAGIDFEVTESRLSLAAGKSDLDGPVATAESIRRVMIFLFTTLAFTLLVMIPITWTYKATRFDTGPSKSFVRALLVLPICATTVVLLIQDSLALAFGLAALVAAVRFRVALNDAIDGIYIFAAICVGLAAGIGYLGVATVMALFFCITNAVLWRMDYGNNPIDEARLLKKMEKLQKP